MENPATWTPEIKKFNELYGTFIEDLSREILLNSRLHPAHVYDIIHAALERQAYSMLNHVCGLSFGANLSGIIDRAVAATGVKSKGEGDE